MLWISFKDAPHEEEARLYKMYDTMLWERLEEKETEHTLKAKMDIDNPEVQPSSNWPTCDGVTRILSRHQQDPNDPG